MFSFFKSKKFYDRLDQVSDFQIDANSISFENNIFKGKFLNSKLNFQIICIESGSFRLKFELEDDSYKRFDVSKESIIFNQEILNNSKEGEFLRNETNCELKYAEDNIEYKIIVQYSPFLVTFYRNGEKILSSNTQKSLCFVSENRDNERTVCEDFTFHCQNALISGLSERATPINIEDNRYQLFNVDAYGFDAGKISSIYGNIPFLLAHAPHYSAGLFWANASDTYLNISTAESKERNAKFASEAGFVDCFIFINDTPLKNIAAYCKLTGFPMMPPLWALGYHQCKWGYKNQQICEEVISKLDESGIPFDCFWFDLDHCKDRCPWHFNPETFPSPENIMDKLDQEKRQFVRLCDCHMPASASKMPEAEETKNSNLLITEKDGRTPYVGLCWPGRSTWVDFLKEEAREWWSNRTKQERGYFWNDMNEPSAFGIFNKSLPKDCKVGEWTDRDVHNSYATFQSQASYKGMRLRDNKRPFSLTRAFFSGTQKYAWAWTGDNGTSLLHMKKSVSMVANSGLCAMPFIGADVGGFSATCDQLTLTKWYQLACWCYPFFREHCIFTASRREPYLFPQEYFEQMKNAVIQRYRMLPFWYTAAWRAHFFGTPIVHPTFLDFPEIQKEHERDSEVLIDGTIFFSASDNVGKRTISLPPGTWYDQSGKQVEGDVEYSGELSAVPVYFRAGRIIPTIEEVTKSALQTIENPITLLIYDTHDTHKAEGDIYIDDCETNDHENGLWVHRILRYENNVLSSTKGETPNVSLSQEDIEKIPIRKINKVVIYKQNEVITREVDIVINNDFTQEL